MLLIVGISVACHTVSADSGWDTSYDSDWGGSSDWGSSYDSDWGSSYDRDYSYSSHSSSSGSSSGYEGGLILLIFISIVFITVVDLIASSSNNSKSGSALSKIKASDMSRLKNIVYTLFETVENAYMNFDYETLKKVSSPAFYTKLSNRMKKLESDNQKDILKDMSLISSEIVSFTNEFDYVAFILMVSSYNYILNTKTDEIVSGSAEKKVLNQYRCTIVKKNNDYVVSDISIIDNYSINSSGGNVKTESSVVKEEINKIFPNIDISVLKKELYNRFIDVQNGWVNFDYNVLRKLCNDEIYNTYYEELEALKLKEEQNIMNNFEKIEDSISNIREENDLIYIDYYLDVKFFDYVINSKTNKIIRGNNNTRVHNIYTLTYVMSKKQQINYCPNCGAKIGDQSSLKCEYCNAIIIKDTNNFVLSKKRKIN